ncbi:M-phase phosphoprotein 6-like [Macrosteles quadrilineatus]|uniref:M-phase phosphoprotein 6-like n=1 Tax=Macrosteles quadrilineatus TaxID=74068 RepID=UPI0023E0D7F0|nr:M-phase phosphoprotein 6-like isoform X2 [Macrosteles quadrilineatus]XP_054290883.1 M-phase phosphoprotein 6-like [Macrosteles quadrilineatus]
MTAREMNKTKLSKGILEMKFMKRTKDKVIKELQDEEGRLMFGNQITEGMRAGMSNYILEPSFIPCEDLIDGRLSFRGMNPEIERLMELEELAKRKPVDRSMATDVSDVEMAKFKESLVETVASKYKTKKIRGVNSSQMSSASNKQEEPPRKRARFLKPKDE